MCAVNDGYIMGATSGHQKKCGRCGEKTLCIDIAAISLPAGVTVKATILHKKGEEDPTLIQCIGIGCGDYAKFHRQISHITDSRMHSGHAV